MARKKEESNETNINDKQSKNEGKDKEKVKDKKATRTEGEVVQKKEEEKLKLEYISKDDLVAKIKKLESELKELKEDYKKSIEEKNSWNNKFVYLQSEFENAQKRWEKNRQNLGTQYTSSVLKNLLPLYDSFKKAVESDAENGVIKGFYNQFMSILKSNGAELMQVKINDPFDYSYHEAISSIEMNDVPNNTIVEIVQDGWKLGKEVIRYAKVVISREPKPPEPEPEKLIEKISEENVNTENTTEEPEPEAGTTPEDIKTKNSENNNRTNSKDNDHIS